MFFGPGLMGWGSGIRERSTPESEFERASKPKGRQAGISQTQRLDLWRLEAGFSYVALRYLLIKPGLNWGFKL